MFELHQQLRKDCFVLGRFPLSYLLLMNDANFPWFILVPARANVREIHELTQADQIQLLNESCYLSRHLAECFQADKMNLAALGNIAPQLHVHHIVRYRNDPAWPAPVWGKMTARPYTDAEFTGIVSRLKETLAEGFRFLA